MPKKCTKCGKQNNDRAKFCNGCGTPFPSSSDVLKAEQQIPQIPKIPQIPTVTPLSNIGSVYTLPPLLPLLDI